MYSEQVELDFGKAREASETFKLSCFDSKTFFLDFNPQGRKKEHEFDVQSRQRQGVPTHVSCSRLGKLVNGRFLKVFILEFFWFQYKFLNVIMKQETKIPETEEIIVTDFHSIIGEVHELLKKTPNRYDDKNSTQTFLI